MFCSKLPVTGPGADLPVSKTEAELVALVTEDEDEDDEEDEDAVTVVSSLELGSQPSTINRANRENG